MLLENLVVNHIDKVDIYLKKDVISDENDVSIKKIWSYLHWQNKTKLQDSITD